MSTGGFFKRIGLSEAQGNYILINENRISFFKSKKPEISIIYNEKKFKKKVKEFTEPFKHYRLGFEKLNKGDVIIIEKLKEGVYEIKK